MRRRGHEVVVLTYGAYEGKVDALGLSFAERDPQEIVENHTEQTPHDWLFPRVSVVIHHRGAGTTAAALRAGVLPFSVDQKLWGRTVERLGAGIAGAVAGVARRRTFQKC